MIDGIRDINGKLIYENIKLEPNMVEWKNRASMDEVLNEYGFDALKALGLVNIDDPQIIYTLLSGIGEHILAPVHLLTGLIIRTSNAFYVLKSLEKIISVNDILYNPRWEFINKRVFQCGIHRTGPFTPPKIDKEFYEGKYFIIDISRFIIRKESNADSGYMVLSKGMMQS